MVVGGAGEGGTAEKFFDSIYEMVRGLVRYADETWGSPWQILLPIGLAALVALILLRGIKSVVSSFEKGAYGYVVAVLLVVVLAVAAALNADRLIGNDEDTDDGEIPPTSIAGGS